MIAILFAPLNRHLTKAMHQRRTLAALVTLTPRMPDYVVLISTLGGLATFGINGFVIGPMIAAMFIAIWEHHATSRGGEPR